MMRLALLFLCCTPFLTSDLIAETDTTAVTPHLKSGKIGFLLSTLQEERYKQDIAFVQAEAKRDGLEVLVEVSNNDSKIERQRFESLLSKGVQVILFQATQPEHVQELIAMAHNEHVPVIAYDREILNQAIDGTVTHDSKEIGIMQAEAALKSTRENLNVLVLAGPEGQPVADDIVTGLESVLKHNVRVKTLEVVHNDLWSPTRALAAVRVRLQAKPSARPNAILASNSSMALAAVQAVKDWSDQTEGSRKLPRSSSKTAPKTGLADRAKNNQPEGARPFIAGADADLSSLQALSKGQIQFEVLKDFSELAQRAVRMALDMVKQMDANDETHFSVKPAHVVLSVYPVDAGNLEHIIQSRHKFSHAEVFGSGPTNSVEHSANEIEKPVHK